MSWSNCSLTSTISDIVVIPCLCLSNMTIEILWLGSCLRTLICIFLSPYIVLSCSLSTVFTVLMNERMTKNPKEPNPWSWLLGPTLWAPIEIVYGTVTDLKLSKMHVFCSKMTCNVMHDTTLLQTNRYTTPLHSRGSEGRQSPSWVQGQSLFVNIKVIWQRSKKISLNQ